MLPCHQDHVWISENLLHVRGILLNEEMIHQVKYEKRYAGFYLHDTSCLGIILIHRLVNLYDVSKRLCHQLETEERMCTFSLRLDPV